MIEKCCIKIKEEYCVVCGDLVPEGLLLCPHCQKKEIHNYEVKNERIRTVADRIRRR